MKQGTESKLKFKKLQRRLGLSRWQCTGLLESLWHVTIENAWLGDIGKLSNEDIAAAIEWDGDAEELIKALIETRWLDESDKFRLVVHNWSVHCPAFLRGNAAKHGHVLADIANGSRNETRNECIKEHRNEPRYEVPAEQNVLPPSLVKPSQVKPSQVKSIQAKSKQNSLSPSATEKKEAALIEREKRFIATYNDLEGVLPNTRDTLSTKRRGMFRARLKEPGWPEDCARAFKEKFPLKMFHGRSGWQPTIEFVLRPDVVMSILEGKYDVQLDGEPDSEPLDIAGALERTRKDGDDD